MPRDLKVSFDQLDLEFLKHADDLYDILFTNLSKCIHLTEDLRDDIYNQIDRTYGIAANKEWGVEKRKWVGSGAYPRVKNTSFSWTNVLNSSMLSFKKKETKESFDLESSFGCDGKFTKGMIFYWQIGHWGDSAKRPLIIDQELLFEVEEQFRRGDSNSSIKYKRYDLSSDNSSIFRIWLKAEEICDNQIVQRHHEAFKNSVIRPVFEHLKLKGKW